MKNKYIYRSQISEKKFREILHFFCLDIEEKTAQLTSISYYIINRIFSKIRNIIA